MLNTTFLQDKKILILGAGLSGMSCARFLASQDIDFSLNDSRDNAVDKLSFNENYPNSYLSTGQWDEKLISAAEIILVSPGIDTSISEINDYLPSSVDMYGDVELYYRLKQTPTVAVTGSNGKSTVVSLVAHIANQIGVKVELTGNIGTPPLDVINDDIDMLVIELSSFQLETLSSMYAVSATVLNLCDDHLDRHKTLENYGAIKQRIYEQTQCAVVNRDDSATRAQHHTKQLSFGENEPTAGEFGIGVHEQQPYLMFGSEPLIAVAKLPLSGKHNAVNCLAALALGYAANWPLSKMVDAITTFKGLPHRCQLIETNDGKQWINDSKATNVGATIAAIEGLTDESHNLLLIAGGQGKGADFSPLSPVLKQCVQQVILFGEDSGLIKASCPNEIEVHQVANLAQATQLASQLTIENDTILFSPACASFDQFPNYIVRGNTFIKQAKEASLCKA